MKKTFLLIPALLFSFHGCFDMEGADTTMKTNDFSFKMKNNSFTVVNFTDTHFETANMLQENSLLTRTIENCIETQKPDLITFSGDNCWGSMVLYRYQQLCNYMDKFKIPYFFILGNHDRESCIAPDITAIVEKSEYGHFIEGDVGDDSYGNYVIQIKNQSDKVIHKLIMIDSRAYYTPKEDEYSYVNIPIDNVIYNNHYDPATQTTRKIYGDERYDTIRGEQINWYKNQVKSNIESTIITHMPIVEYTKAIEQYFNARKNGNETLIEQIHPIGHCVMGESVSCCVRNYDFFKTIKQCGSTKNIICGHDHVNDFSLNYNGIRLTYGVKTGSGCYWDESGETNGCTTLKIDATGAASISQYYFKTN